MTTSTQYDAIGAAYASMKLLPGALLERENVHAALAPYIRDAAVLDLACGTGYYSRHLLDWGAARVEGVDISPAMVSAAEAASAESDLMAKDSNGKTKLSFFVGDAMKSPLPADVVAQGPYDVVVGAWLLNYAPSTEAMKVMFSNIADAFGPSKDKDKNKNKGGRRGVFVGITPHAAQDLDAFAASHGSEAAKHEMRHHLGVTIDYLSPLPSGEGYNTRVTGHTKPVEISFENFHLRRECYEAAARAVGATKVGWKTMQMPLDRDKCREYGIHEDPEAFWDKYGFEKRPHMGIMVVEF